MANQVATSRRSKVPSVLYLYGITTHSKRTLAAPRVGIDGISPVQPIEAGEFVCWVSPVDAVEFGENLQSNMDKLEWLADASVRHQQVVGSLAEQTDVLPARFGTVFTSEASLLDDIKRRKRAIASTLKRVAGADEWGVKVFSDPAATVSTAITAKSGRDYLQRKAAVLQQRTERKPDKDVTRLQTALKKVSAGIAPLGKISSGQRNLVWQASFLVKRTNKTKFNSVLRQFASNQKDKTVECTGPWPPYSFVSEDGR